MRNLENKCTRRRSSGMKLKEQIPQSEGLNLEFLPKVKKIETIPWSKQDLMFL